MPDPNETKIQTESTKIQSATTAKNTGDTKAAKTVQEADQPKAVAQGMQPKFVPTVFDKQELGDASPQDDGTVVRVVKLSEPQVPDGAELDPRFKTQTQKVTYRNNKRISCEILDAENKPVAQINTAMLDG